MLDTVETTYGTMTVRIMRSRREREIWPLRRASPWLIASRIEPTISATLTARRRTVREKATCAQVFQEIGPIGPHHRRGAARGRGEIGEPVFADLAIARLGLPEQRGGFPGRPCCRRSMASTLQQARLDQQIAGAVREVRGRLGQRLLGAVQTIQVVRPQACPAHAAPGPGLEISHDRGGVHEAVEAGGDLQRQEGEAFRLRGGDLRIGAAQQQAFADPPGAEPGIAPHRLRLLLAGQRQELLA